MKVDVFISSNIEEFSHERKLIKEEISKDPLFSQIFNVFLFEEEISKPDSEDKVFINEVEYAESTLD